MKTEQAAGAPWPVAKGAQPRSLVHQSPIPFFLRDPEDVRNPLYSLVVQKMDHRRPTAMAQFDQTSTAAGAPFSGTPSPRCAPTAAGQARVPSPGDGTAWEALVRQINGGGWLGGGGSVLGQIHMRDGPIYSGNPIYS
jgi:hypothetical protein